MAKAESRLDDQRYVSWLKGTLALCYFKEGIQDIAEVEAGHFHAELLKTVPRRGSGQDVCNRCTSASITKDDHRQRWQIPCALSICNLWLDQIIQHHSNQTVPDLCPENTHPRLWPSSPWEVCKMYMPFGCHGDKNAKDADVHCILSLFKNCLHYQQCGRVERMDLIDELLSIRNSLCHSGTMQVDGAALEDMLKTMLDFLGGLRSLSATERMLIQPAVDKIIQLQTKTLDLSMNRELELQALQAKKSALEKDLRNLEDKVKASTAMTSSKENVDESIGSDMADVNHYSEARSSCGINGADSRSPQQEDACMETDTEYLPSSELLMKRLQEVQASFNSFLQAYDLTSDLSALAAPRSHPGHKMVAFKKQCTGLSHTDKQLVNQTGHLSGRWQTGTMGQHVNKIDPTSSASLHPRKTEPQSHTNVLQLSTATPELHEKELRSLGAEKHKAKNIPEKRKIIHPQTAYLQEILIQHYRNHCLSVPNPAAPDCIPFENLYVDQDLKVLRESQYARSGLMNSYKWNKPATLSRYREIFYTEDYQCTQIYIQGEAGSGKTMFCKNLVNIWCKVHSDAQATDAGVTDSKEMDWEEETWHPRGLNRQRRAGTRNVSEEDRQILSDFNLLFYITLRDSLTEYNVIDMIESQLLRHNEFTQHLNASDLLQDEACLIILDGLDEWKCPEGARVPHFLNPAIPGRLGLYDNNTFLTTTRPWAFDVFELKSSEVDKHVELSGLNMKASKWLCSKVMGLLNNTARCQQVDQGCLPLSIRQYHSVPFVLIQLICLWFDQPNPCQSEVKLYCEMLEMLFKRAEKNLYEVAFSTQVQQLGIHLPNCFSRQPHCQVHKDILHSLSGVAFEGLFDENRKERLVFNSSNIGLYGVSQEDVDLCLKSGILSQHRMTEKCSVREKRITFLHKKLQEFLAAVYITMSWDCKSLLAQITNFCTSVESMLEKANVWMFVSGIRPSLARYVVETLMTQVVSADERLQNHRQFSNGLLVPDMLKSIQTCMKDLVQEAVANGHNDFHLPLEDFVISTDTFCRHTEKLIEANLAKLKSVYITVNTETPETDQNLDKLFGQLRGIQTLQKLYINDPGSALAYIAALTHIISNFQNSLKCLELLHLELTTGLSAAVSSRVRFLTTLTLWQVKVTHHRKEQLLSLEQTNNMRELSLWLDCTDHNGHCRPVLDLSGYTQIQKLQVWHMLVDNLLAVSHSLEQVDLRCVTVSVADLRQFIHILPTISHRVKVALYDVTITGDSDSRKDLETELKHNENLVVTRCECEADENRWWIIFFFFYYEK